MNHGYSIRRLSTNEKSVETESYETKFMKDKNMEKFGKYKMNLTEFNIWYIDFGYKNSYLKTISFKFFFHKF